ncbi:MAG: hypothetical protein RI928_21 [Pseudomonadota bacterium]
MCATLRSLLLAMVAVATLTACNSGPKNYDECMLQASREGKNDRQFRKLAEECKEKFRSKE